MCKERYHTDKRYHNKKKILELEMAELNFIHAFQECSYAKAHMFQIIDCQ